MTAHIDLLPTLSKLCGTRIPEDRKIDGRNFIPSIEGKIQPERSFFSYWTRKYPELFNNIALQRGQFKLVGKTDYDSEIENFQLYDTNKDPFEKNNLIAQKKSIGLSLKEEMHQTFLELVNSENLKNPPRIILGSDFENPVYLNRNDAGGQRAVWNQEQAYSFWKVDINKEGLYDLKFKFLKPLPANGNMYLEIGQSIQQKLNPVVSCKPSCREVALTAEFALGPSANFIYYINQFLVRIKFFVLSNITYLPQLSFFFCVFFVGSSLLTTA